MIVTAETELLAMMSAALATGGFGDVVEARSAQEALALIEPDAGTSGGAAVDALLLDMTLPDADGVETCATIRLNVAHKDTPIVVLAEPGDTQSLSQAFVAGASDYIFKPFHDVELLARMRSILRNKVQLDRRRATERELQRLRRPASIWRASDGPVIEPDSGLPGRGCLTGSLTWHARRDDGASMAVIVARIDALTSFRHLYGADAASGMIGRVAARIGDLVAPLNHLLAAFDTGSFAIVCAPAADGARELAEAARRCVADLQIPHMECAFRDSVSASVGMALGVRVSRERVAQLLPSAISAAEQAAAEGGDRVVVVEGL
jgi:PleD family two-component response regulator